MLLNSNDVDPRVTFTVRLARGLHRYGTPTHELEETMNMVLGRLGLSGMFFSTPTGIFAAFGEPEEHRTSLIRSDGNEMNLEKLCQLDELADSVIQGRIDATEGSKRVEEIVAASERYPAWLMVTCFAITSAAAGRFFGGGWREMVVAFIAGAAIGLVGLLSEKSRRVGLLMPIVSGILAAGVGAIASGFLIPLSPYIVTLAALIVLVPGLTTTTAMTELATGNLVSGTARLMGGVLTFLELAFGAALGQQIVGLFGLASPNMRPEHLEPWTMIVAIVVSSFTLVVLMRARPGDVKWMLVASLVGFGGARLGTWLLGPELGALIGATMLALTGNIFARIARRSSMLINLPGLILLVPGSIGFGSLSKFIDRDVLSGVGAAFNVALVATAIATGLLVANAILPSKRGV